MSPDPDVRGVDDRRAQAAWQARRKVPPGEQRGAYAQGYLDGREELEVIRFYTRAERMPRWVLPTIFATGLLLGVLLRALWR